jgi:hypothetical protein
MQKKEEKRKKNMGSTEGQKTRFIGKLLDNITGLVSSKNNPLGFETLGQIIRTLAFIQMVDNNNCYLQKLGHSLT